ncbi:MAG: ceramidase domain-containing protein [Anaerolineae bacterium]
MMARVPGAKRGEALLPYLVSFAIVSALVLGLALWSRSGYSWAGWEQDGCLTAHCFCEAPRAGPIVQPSNTYSNLALVLAGLVIAVPVLFRKRAAAEAAGANRMRGARTYPVVLGLALALGGLGSLWYHASLTAWGAWADVMGVILLLSFILLYNLSRLHPLSGRAFAVGYLVLNLALSPFASNGNDPVTLGVLVLSSLALEVLVRLRPHPPIRTRDLLLAVGTFLIGAGLWVMDTDPAWCNPQSWLQAHAGWHVLSAVAGLMLYSYYRSERPLGDAKLKKGAGGVPVSTRHPRR